jgi:hypothetical protein
MAGITASGPASRREAARAALTVLGREVLGPYLVYLVLHRWGGLSNLAALVAAAVASALLVVVSVVRTRQISPFAAVVFLTLVLGIAISLWTGDARLTLARDAVISGGLGLAMLISLATRPLMFSLMWSLRADAGNLGQRWLEVPPETRRRMRVVTGAWGVGLITDAVVRVILVWSLTVEEAATAVTALTLVTVALLVLWMRWYLTAGTTIATSQVVGDAPQAVGES